MTSSLLSGVLGLVRTKYIAAVFGASRTTDAYNAAFNLPDMINYFLVGGVASITLTLPGSAQTVQVQAQAPYGLGNANVTFSETAQ